MGKHTPGPWTFESANGDVFGSEHLGLPPAVYTKFLIMSDRSSGVREVCAMTVPTHAEFNQMAEANARLMAASPDLLKACKAMDAELMFLAAQGRAREKPSLDVISMLRAAIAKAEGGAA